MYGRGPKWLEVVHWTTGVVLIGLMGALPWITVHAGGAQVGDDLRRVCWALCVLYPVVTITFGVLFGLGLRQARSRGIVRDLRKGLARKRLRDAARAAREGGADPAIPTAMWTQPRHWLDWYGFYERAIWAIGYCWLVAAALRVVRPGWVLWGTAAFLAIEILALIWPIQVAPLERFEIGTVQQNTLYAAAGTTCGRLWRLRIGEQQAAFRTAMQGLVTCGIIGGEWRRDATGSADADGTALDGRYTVTIGLSRRGLDALGVCYQWRGPRTDAFDEGMKRRAAHSGDEQVQWDRQWDEIDGAIWIYASTTNKLDTITGELAPGSTRSCVNLRSTSSVRPTRASGRSP